MDRNPRPTLEAGRSRIHWQVQRCPR